MVSPCMLRVIFTFLFKFLTGTALIVSLFNLFCLWLEQKGWLYYKRKRPLGGTVGNALQELQTLLIPSNKYVVEVKRNEVQCEKQKIH